MRTQLSLPIQFGGLGIGDNVAIADASHIGAAAVVVGQAVTFLRAQHATMSDAGAFFSDPSGVSSPHSLYLVGASSIHQALATPTLELDAGANASAPMWAVELRAAHTRVVDECGDAVLEDLAGPLASALKLLPSKRSHVARAGCSVAGAEPASAMRSAADLQAIPHYSDFPLHSMRKVQETLSHRIHTVRFAKLAARMPTSGPDSNRFRGRLLRAATAFLVTDPPKRRKIQKYDEGVRNAAGMLRFVPFAVSEFGSLVPHAEAFLVELAKASQAHTGQKIGQLLSAWRRRFSLLIDMAHADNVLGGVAAARAARDVWCSCACVASLVGMCCYDPGHWLQASSPRMIAYPEAGVPLVPGS
eukprot:jgi/Tetstr1/426841/TSEL_017056.t1